ncbi:P-loop containing nucleoside triphosphate hydrolase protein [Ramaria rubella]|nr:P-loop containing nucleoside triphosphate hydrolase protein [Ramaria rubella]
MPRKVQNSDGDSQKENQSILPSMSKTKVKAERGSTAPGSSTKLNRVASRVEVEDEQDEDDVIDGGKGPLGKSRSGTLTSRSEDEEADNDRDGQEGEHEDEDEDEDEDESGSPNGKKRVRLNEEGDAKPVKEKVKIQRQVTLPRDRDGYVPGSIVRVQLENFVTYDYVEFCPGANLNMIFGPNGTGKSSIACAICIGLNGAPSLLGRSNELNAFVKQGHESGYVEIELKGRIGTPNLVIRRSINSRNRSSQFTLNGAAVPGREINERIAELNVQVGNLCSFLPQDRVSEFAQMTPQQLLKETQRTAGHESLTLWHNGLIEKGKELKVAQKASILQDESKHVLQLEEKQKSLEKDVKRYNERRTIERQIELLELVLPYVEYRESKAVYDETKAARDRAAVEYRQMEEQNRPMKVLQGELNEEHDKLNGQRKALKTDIKRNFEKTRSSITQRNKHAAVKAEEALEKIKAIKRTEKDLVRNKAKTREEIERLQEKVNNPPELEPKEVGNKVTDLKVKRVEMQNQVHALAPQSSDYENTIRVKQQELREQEDHMKRKFFSLQKWDPECAAVVDWLMRQRETNDFAKRVELPAYMEVTVRDKSFVNAVEACFSANQFKTFITHSEEDYNTFNRLFIDTPEALGRKMRVTVWYRPHNMAQLLRPPLSTEELHGLGFNGYAIDYVECPDGLKWFLMKELNMHRTPIAPRQVDDNRVQAALSRLGPDGRSPPGASYISGHTLATVSRSAYGQQKTFTVTRSFREARNFVHPALDPAIKHAINQQIAEAQQRADEINANIKALQDEDKDILKVIGELKLEFDALHDRLTAIKRSEDMARANAAKLESLKKKLLSYEKQPSPEAERKKYKDIVEKTVKERSKILAEFVDLIKITIKNESALAVISLKQIQLAANVQAIDTLCNERTAEAKRVKQTFEEAAVKFEAAKKDSTDKVKITREKLASVDDELQQTFKQLEEEDQQKDPNDRWTSGNVAALLETEQAKLDLNHATDSGVIAAYEARQNEIATLQESVKTKEKKFRRLQEQIQKTRDRWYPALTELVTAIGEKFSAAFDQAGINCAGEIRIAENEEYDKWAIEIFVKFRDGEPLTLLTGQRQSGGERSLTTILYLMSLTEYARAPFSLVDEINQGMDQRYERAVHDQLVEVTCKADSGQYFLITPKLLPGLQYHKSMKILCVNNGEWLPESSLKGVGNMQKMIEDFIARPPPPSAA